LLAPLKVYVLNYTYLRKPRLFTSKAILLSKSVLHGDNNWTGHYDCLIGPTGRSCQDG